MGEITTKPGDESGPDDTGQKQALTQFKPGQSGNPRGRPRGARSKLSEQFIEALAADFEQHGVATIQLVRQREPATYIKVIKDILPREAVLMAFNLRKDLDQVGFADDASPYEILAVVAQEAGEEAAQALAKMFNLEYSGHEVIEGDAKP